MKELEFIYKRASVRKFKDEPVVKEHLEEIIKAATAAPSGNNLQTWHFVAVTDKTKIKEIAAIIERKHNLLCSYLKDKDEIKAFKGKLGYHTIFKSAPVLILVYAGPYPSLADVFSKEGLMSADAINELRKANPGIQNISAAMENLLLAASSLGYGTCWMTGPTYAVEEISSYIEFEKIVGKKDYFLAAMTPLGIPFNGFPTSPKRKPLQEVLTVI